MSVSAYGYGWVFELYQYQHIIMVVDGDGLVFYGLNCASISLWLWMGSV